MKKPELVAALTEQMTTTHNRTVSKADVEALLESLATVTIGALKSGDDLTIPFLGKFSTSHRAARKGRHPQTGAEIEIAAATVAKFTPVKVLKEALN